MKQRSYSIEKIINSNPETLFTIVSDFQNYHKWNRVIPSGRGELIKGSKLQLMMHMNGKTKPFNPAVIAVDKNKSFLLSKTIVSKAIGELTHKFEFLELENNQTKLIQTWEGKGVLVKLMWPKIQSEFSNFAIFNDDLISYLETQGLNHN